MKYFMVLPFMLIMLKFFGCIAYYMDFSPKKGKLDPNGKKRFFLRIQ